MSKAGQITLDLLPGAAAGPSQGLSAAAAHTVMTAVTAAVTGAGAGAGPELAESASAAEDAIAQDAPTAVSGEGAISPPPQGAGAVSSIRPAVREQGRHDVPADGTSTVALRQVDTAASFTAALEGEGTGEPSPATVAWPDAGEQGAQAAAFGPDDWAGPDRPPASSIAAPTTVTNVVTIGVQYNHPPTDRIQNAYSRTDSP